MTMNSKLMFLPLKELQHYLVNLEFENEKLKTELTTISRFNCILENIRRSSNKGFNSMQLVDRNKTCRCNEHLNGHLRRMAQEADIELRVWQEQYDKLVLKTKHDYMSAYDEDNRSLSLSPRSSTGHLTPPQEIQCLDPELDTSTLSLSSSNTCDTGYMSSNKTMSVGSSSPLSGVRSPMSDSENANFSFNNNRTTDHKNSQNKDKQNNNLRDSSTVRYVTLSPPADESTTSRSSPLVVFESPKLVCDWPDCRRVFSNEEILIHHRRNHIRKSIYHCDFCSTRLLSKEELDNHMKKHRHLNREDSRRDAKPPVAKDEVTSHQDMDVLDIENTSEAVNLSNKSHINTNNNNSVNDMNYNNVNQNGLTFQSALFDRLSAHHQKSTSPPIVKSNDLSPQDTSPDNQQLVRPDEYKRTRYSGVGRYRCPWPDCGYTPHFLRDLRRHMFKHTGDKKHKCDSPGCDFVSVWKTSLLQHQRKKHFLNTNPNPNDSAI